jgi:hypothetical protein
MDLGRGNHTADRERVGFRDLPDGGLVVGSVDQKADDAAAARESKLSRTRRSCFDQA